MSQLSQALMSEATFGRTLSDREVSRFTPAEIRGAIADLVALEKTDLASALCDAGLSLYPDSEDILAIAALLAESRQDWTTAEQLLAQLILKQAGSTPAATWQHYIRVLRCLCELQSALQITEHALQFHPTDPVLMKELESLMVMLGDSQPMQTTDTRH